MVELKLLKIAIVFFTTLAGEVSGHGISRMRRTSTKKEWFVAIMIFMIGFILALILTWYEETHRVSFDT